MVIVGVSATNRAATAAGPCQYSSKQQVCNCFEVSIKVSQELYELTQARDAVHRCQLAATATDILTAAAT